MNFDEIPIPEVRDFSASPAQQAALIAAIREFPSFETERLRIRPVQMTLNAGEEAADAQNLYKVLGSPEVHRWIYIFKNGFALEDALNVLKESSVKRAQGTGIEMLIEDKRDGKILGEIGAQFIDPRRLAADMGYAIASGPDTQRKGYATEAAEAFIHVLCGLGIQHIVLTAAPNNEGSIRVITKLGIPQITGVTLPVTDPDGTVLPRNLYYVRSKDWSAQRTPHHNLMVLNKKAVL